MYRRCCRLLTMVAVNAAPAAAVLLTDGANNSTAAHHFLITQPPPAAARMERDDNNTSFVIIDQGPRERIINISSGLLLYYHQCSFYSQKVGRDCKFVLCVCVVLVAKNGVAVVFL